MKQGWEKKKLGEVCEVIAGQSPEGKFYNPEGNGMPFYQGKKEYGEKYIGEPTTWTTKITKEAEAGDILMSVRAPVGPVNFATQKICIGRGLAAIRAGKKIDKEFLFSYLVKHESEIEGNAGAVFNSINKTQIENLEIPLPPLPEQQRIVSILDECFSAIDKAKANAEQNLKNAKELFESYLQGVFDPSTHSGRGKSDGWEEKKLGEVAFVKSGGTPLRHKTEYWNGNIAWYSSGELNNLYTNDPERHINELAIENSNAKLFPKGSLLIGMYDTAALKMSILDRDAAFNQAIAGVKPNAKIDLIFILHSINAVKPEILNLRRGVRQKNLSLDKIKNIPIALPSLQTQQTIVRQLDTLRAETQKLEAVYQKKISDLEELKKSILHKAFAGELRSPEGAVSANDGYSPSEKKIKNKVSPERA
jgi:type I restriction enzyme S subunit